MQDRLAEILTPASSQKFFIQLHKVTLSEREREREREGKRERERERESERKRKRERDREREEVDTQRLHNVR